MALHGVSSSLLGPVDPPFRALSGRLEFTDRRRKFNKDSLWSRMIAEDPACMERYQVKDLAKKSLSAENWAGILRERESSLLTTYWSGSTDVFGVPASRHGSLNPLFQVALYLPS